MRLIPPTISETTQSDGERAVFEALAASADGAGRGGGGGRAGGAAAGPDTAGWTVLHSFDIADHRRRLAGEIDFLCLVPGEGVLVVEVKGCHSLRRHGGDWYYGRSAEPDHRGPFRQASEAMHSLRRRLARQHPELSRHPVLVGGLLPVHRLHRDLAGVERLAGDRPPRAAGAAHRAAHQQRARPRQGAAGRAQRPVVPPRAGRAHAAAVRRAGRPPAPGLRVLREPQVASAARRGGGAPLHRGAVRGAGRDRPQPAHRLRRTGRHGQDAAGDRGRAARRQSRAPRAPALLQPAARPLAAGGGGRPGTRGHGAHAARAPARPCGHRAHARAALPPGVLAGGAARDGPRGAARARGQAQLLRRDRAGRSPGRAAPQLPRGARPEPATAGSPAATGASSATSPGSASTTRTR